MDKIYDEYYYKIYYWAIKKTNNKEDAEDLTNSVFLSIFEYFNKNISVEKVENLIWKIAYNLYCTKAKEYIKEKNNTTFDPKYQLGYEIEMIDKIIYKEIINDLDGIGLTDKEKASFKMYYMNDLSIKEISKKLDTKETNIKYYLYSARNKVKERYNE
ncbi:MAG: sigma-70 family RNA polymerase sigma factor [Malacoplasma sp.]